MFRYASTDLVPPAGRQKEWLLTNGIGGFAASTISGINTRRYHGLLIASLKPPVDRRLLLAKLEEEVIVDGKRYKLFASQTLGGFAGYGFNYLLEFKRFPFPTYVYEIEDCILKKEIILVSGQNTVMVRYSLANANERPVRLCIFPLITCRDYHSTIRRNDWRFEIVEDNGTSVAIEPFPGAPLLYMGSDGARCEKTGFWYFDIFYEREAERGLDAVEDLYCPLCFVAEGAKSTELWIWAGTEQVEGSTACMHRYRDQEISRIKAVADNVSTNNKYLRLLSLAADSFLVRRSELEGLTIIAGYPWFADWGRDAMVSLPGLTLTTGRFEDFRQVMKTFLTFEKDGLIPNLFPDNPGPPAYNTADASLWVFWCLYKYYQYTADLNFLAEQYPVLLRILEGYINGTTLHGIRMDSDGLIIQGETFQALTWMDARVGGEAVTPRRGKTVEINALWCFALYFTGFLASRLDDTAKARSLKELFNNSRNGYRRGFWFADGGYLYDWISEDERDESIRCNQVIALSLPIRLLTVDQERKVLGTVWRHLCTGYGLRTLSPADDKYRGQCTGNQYQRDSAYHQGTVWVWPWGHFITALNRIYSGHPGIDSLIRRLVSPLIAHLHEECIGTVSEIFDGDPPHHPRGCFAQAWSVAELLRVIYEEVERRAPKRTLPEWVEKRPLPEG
ncbi:MAG: glycogen debranching protein [Syntrophomonadaceae bacterium]|jgi:predicted glycogen debranching enzyme|nr:glycogen debranching protein [Syntrophomonadaceae bacterium]